MNHTAEILTITAATAATVATANDAAVIIEHAFSNAVSILCAQREDADLPRQRHAVASALYQYVMDRLHDLPDELVNHILNTPNLHLPL
jgi:hypothetical protein